MTNPMPETYYDAPPLNPIGGDLYAAATVVDQAPPSRFYGGLVVRPTNCAPGYGTFATDICLVPPEGTLLKGGRTEPLPTFMPIGVWAADECDLTDPDVEARARQTLRLKESNLVESAFGDRLLSDAAAELGTIPTSDYVFTAVSALEAELAATGFAGVIHASAKIAALVAPYNLIVRSGSALKTPLGHTWAFGGGYVDTLENTLVATGPVTIWRDELVTRTASMELRGQSNEQIAIAERSVLVGYECFVSATTINL